MNFQQKNFEYVTMTFGDFLSQIEDNKLLYMRAVSAERTAKATDLSTDFPTIADDFSIPPELSYVRSRIHSSPLRISGPVRMWLHYDVMANILCQVRGRKRVRLFPPSAHAELGFKAGSTTSSLDVFPGERSRKEEEQKEEEKEEEGRRKEAKVPKGCYEATLNPGDILYIPPLWPHAVDAPDHRVGGFGEKATVAVNVFFRSFEQGRYAPGKDIYGNRDLQAYEHGRQGVARIEKAFDGLPGEVRRFYIERLARELFDMAGTGGD